MNKSVVKKVITVMICICIILITPIISTITLNLFQKEAVEEYVSKVDNKDTVINEYSNEDKMKSVGIGWLEEENEPIEEVFIPNNLDPGPQPYPKDIETNSGEIKEVTYSKYGGTTFLNLDKGGQVKNLTSISNQNLLSQSRLIPEFKIEKNGEPQVLIMHTHTTESFEPYDRDFFDKSFNSRTTEATKNIVMVGNEIAKQLESVGITTIHDQTIHDYPSYTGSYSRSCETVQKILDEFPSIKVVFDVHRDAIYSDDSWVKPIVEINNEKVAQIMIVSGCDDGTMGMPNYMENFKLASLLQSTIEREYPGITRPLLFDYRKYNQQLTTGSLLIEVGSHANSLEQARLAGVYTGEAIAKALLEITE